MKEYKTTRRMYGAWNYQQEIDDLNAQSEKGWQLVKGGSFSSRFRFNDTIRYRYQLDYQPKIEDRPRYVESFREFGWEYINSTFNGWHYFRKPYDPALPEEEYEIFTDRSSLHEMNNRWAKLGTALLIVCSLMAVLLVVVMIMRPTLPTLMMLIEYALLLFMLGRGVHIMKNPDSSKSRKGDNALTSAIFTAIFLCLAANLCLSELRADCRCTMQAEYMDALPAQVEEACLWNTVEVKYPDFYHLDLDIKADAPLTFTVLNEAGETVYTVTGADVLEEDVRLLLHRGEYRIYISDFAGGAMEINFNW